ncbi:METTL5 family protein [Candidatus Woesearchaeota archaeon]|nr:METTL5 family protein [Candidatus Woesearchaeota archaeon]
MTKSKLAIMLSKLKGFESPKLKAEQYVTDSEIAADVLWFAYMHGDIKGKIVADLGCGTGILGIGALALGARKVVFVDNDEEVMEICKANSGKYLKKSEFIATGIKDFGGKSDTVIQNPPFGTKTKHADKEFLSKAFETAQVVYSFHKLETRDFIEKFAEDNEFEITALFEYNFPLKATQFFHTRKIHRIKVGCWRFEHHN